MALSRQIVIPSLVRVKEEALDRLGIYLRRCGHQKVIVLVSEKLHAPLEQCVRSSLECESITIASWLEVPNNDFGVATEFFVSLPVEPTAVVGVGGR